MPAARKPRKPVDPYREYSFRVRWDGRIVAGITKVSALRRATEVVEYRDGASGATLKLPAAIGFDAITLERGMTRDTCVRGLGTPGLRRNRGAIGVSEGGADRGLRRARTVGSGV
jgi:T4-like virus tail tube protein gp19